VTLSLLACFAVYVIAEISHSATPYYLRLTALAQRTLSLIGIKPPRRYIFDYETFKRVHRTIHEAARTHGVDPALVKAVIYVESRFNSDAVSRRGARGLMQLMPATARELGVKNSFNEKQNIHGGTKYLRQLLKRFRGNISLSVAGYNAGPNAVKSHGGIPPYRETRAYVREVLTAYRRFQKTDGPPV
jgi:soluble lytic murein transglycosylase-like protein